MDPTRKNCAKPKPQTVDTIPSSTLKKKITAQCQSKWNANHKPHAALKGADVHPRVHTNLQAKAMTISANADPSITSLVRHKGHHKKSTNGAFVVEMEKREKLTEAKEGSKTKPCHGDQLKVQAKIKSLEIDEPKRPSISLVSGRRRSFCDSRIELSEFFSGAGVKVVAVDMPPFMQIHAVSCARKAYDSLEKLSSKTLALTLKKEFDGVYGPAWHCIVGSSFGSFVTHSVGGFLYFSMDQKLYFLLFKTTVQRAAD